jgi:hypothetical protein
MACVDAATAKASTTTKNLITISFLQTSERQLLSMLGCCRTHLFGYFGVRAYSGLAKLRGIALQTRFAQRPDSLVANLTKANRSFLWILSSKRIQSTECQE